jgi:hypothetical protein
MATNSACKRMKRPAIPIIVTIIKRTLCIGLSRKTTHKAEARVTAAIL